jgi:hypothetical protein
MALTKSTSFNSLYFPPELANDSRPLVQFSCNKARSNYNDAFSIFLPIPQSLQFSDAATYNDVELNIAGALGGALSAAQTGGITGASNYLAKTAANSLPSSLGELGQLAATMTPLPESVRSAVNIGLGTTLNKNITTEFTGMATRQHAFQFKLMSKSMQESETIRNIARAFRIGLYADGDTLQLNYPPTWSISFLHKSGTVLEYIPKIYECYLSGMTSSYNQTANLWFSDGAPLECDINLTFVETRALTAGDIKSLDDEPFSSSKSQTSGINFNSAPSIPSNLA